MRRTVLVAALLALPASLPAPPSALAGVSRPAPSAASRSGAAVVVTGSRLVHLITGDTVRVLTRDDGRTEGTVVAGPHAGAAVARWGTATSSYLMPRTPAAERSRLDPSLFDVSRLAALRGARVPVVVRLQPHAAPTAVRNLTAALGLRREAARSSGAVRSIPGSYAAGFRGLRLRDLVGVRSIRLAHTPPTPRVSGPTHALTVQVRTGAGNPARGVVLFIENVDDAHKYLETPYTGKSGRVTVNIPEGDYAVLAWDFHHLLVAPEFEVTADHTLALDLADATVRPRVTLPNHRVIETVLGVARDPEAGFSFGVQFSGPRFSMRVQPAGQHLAHGALYTGVSATLVPAGSGHGAGYRRIVMTADITRGVPADLTYAHHRDDFARVVQRFFGNGKAGLRQTNLGASAVREHGGVDLFTGKELDTPMPGRRVLWLQAARHVYYQQTALPQATPDRFDLTQEFAVRRYPKAGTTHVVSFTHGPVGPGIEGSDHFAGLTRRRGHLQAYLPLFSGAGSAIDSYVDSTDGEWSLRQGHRLLDRGQREIAFAVAVPARRRAYVLRASSHPTSPGWELSTRVDDVWTFHSRAGAKVPRLLTPSYLPPSTLKGYLPPGPTSYALRFLNQSGADRVAHATFDLSTDHGQHWTAARLVRTAPDAFRVRYLNPARRPAARFMSLRVSGQDAHGNSVRETALDVYRLR